MIPQKGPQVALLPPMNLYREDLEKIVSVFRQHCRNVTIGDQENVYGSMDEMAERVAASTLLRGDREHSTCRARHPW
jgi:hypothetical protein